MQRLLAGAFFVIIMAVFLPFHAEAASFWDTVGGRILLDVENNGEAWYVNPLTLERSYLGRPADALAVMSRFGLGISDLDLSALPASTDTMTTGSLPLRERLSGRILLEVESHGEAWYVYPGDLRRYFLGRPDDAFRIMSDLGLGITPADLARIAIDPSSLNPVLRETSALRSFTLTNARGSFPVHVLTLDRHDYEMVTDTAEQNDCDHDCDAFSLQTFVERNNGIAGINGSYFCPPDYPACDGKENTFLPPVFNTSLDRMINEDQLVFFNRPMITHGSDGVYLYFHRAPQFGDSVLEFETRTRSQLTSGIGNWPSLVENGRSVVADEPSEPAFLVRSTRGGIGWNDSIVYLVIASGATMEDFASIFQSIGAMFAMNLDGGGSSALFVDGHYVVGPGRNLPNAIIFQKRP